MASNTASGSMAQNQYLQITPSNLLSTGTISFSGGNPVIQFLIAPQNRYLIGASVRLAGKLKFYSAPNTRNVLSGAAQSQLNINARLGAYALIDQLTLKAGSGPATGQTLEHIRHWNRMMATYLSNTASYEDAIGHLQETSLGVPNYNLVQQAVARESSIEGSNFCINLPCGMFNGQNPIPLWMSGGILVEIALSPNSNCLFAQEGVLNPGGAVPDITDCSYQLSDVYLLCETMNPPDNILKSIGSGKPMSYTYNSIHTFFSTINSTNAITNFNLSLKNVLGVFGNYIEAASINNLVFDSMTTLPPNNDSVPGGITGNLSRADITKIIWTRGGVKFPLQYDEDMTQKDLTILTNGNQNRFIDPQIIRGYNNAVTQFSGTPGRLQGSPNNTFYTGNNRAGWSIGGGNRWNAVDGGSCFGVGVALDQISDQGVDYSETPFGLNMNLNLTTNTPNAFYMFAHARQTLILSGNGLQILS